MHIRRAKVEDIEGIDHLLYQVLEVHHKGRPDLFKGNTKKYTDQELKEIIADDRRPIFVGVDEKEQILGYAFCVHTQHENDNVLTPIKTLYIDDICVDESARRQHVGKQIYEYVCEYARQEGYYNVTLNVWNCNPGAMSFYESLGMQPYKVGMETIL